MLTITKRLEFDAGHRIPQHKSQCRNLHGHRYALEITLEGELSAEQRARLMEIADKCPVHRTLHSEIDVRTREAA